MPAHLSYRHVALGKQRVDGNARQQQGGNEEAGRFSSPKGTQSPLVLDSLLAELDTGANLSLPSVQPNARYQSGIWG